MRLHKRQLVFEGINEILHFENNRLILSDIIMEDKFTLLAKLISSAMIELSLIWKDTISKTNINNRDWGYDFFDEPDFLRKLHAWLETTDASNLVVSSLTTFWAGHNVV